MILDWPVSGAVTVTIDWADSYHRPNECRIIRRDLKNIAAIRFSIDLRRAVAMEDELRAECRFEGDDAGGHRVHHERGVENPAIQGGTPFQFDSPRRRRGKPLFLFGPAP